MNDVGNTEGLSEIEWLEQHHPTIGQVGTPEYAEWVERAAAHDRRRLAEVMIRNRRLRSVESEALSLLRELVDIYRRPNGSVEELYEAMGRAYALVERVSQGDEA